MKLPTLIQIETSTNCSANCIFCPHSTGLNRQTGTMPMILFKSIVKEAYDLGIKKIIPFLNGEPFVTKNIFGYLEVLRQYEMHTDIFTNASHLSEEKAINLISYKDVVDSVVFSVAGIDKETHKEIMGLKHNKVVENIKFFINLNKGQISVSAHMPMMSKTAPFERKWDAYWREIVGVVGTTRMYNWAGDIKDDMEYKGTKCPCGRLDHLTVLWDGKCALCCMDAHGKVIVGDLSQQSIVEVFNSDILKYYREMHSHCKFADLDLCKDCNLNMI